MDKCFPSIPAELNLRIFSKLAPVAYIRFRKTCRAVNNFCDINRHRLGIRFEYEHAILSLSFSKDGNRITVDLEQKKGGNRLITNLSGKTVSFLWAAISGFHFDKIQAKGYPVPFTDSQAIMEKFVPYFIQATSSLRPSTLIVRDFPGKLIDDLARNWNLERLHLAVTSRTIDPGILGTIAFQEIPEVELVLKGGDVNLLNILSVRKAGRMTLFLAKNQNYTRAFWPQIPQVLQEWQIGALQIDHLTIDFASGVFDRNNPNTLKTVPGAHYLNYFSCKPWNWDGHNFYRENYIEWWLFQMEGARWGFIEIHWNYDCLTLLDVTTPEGFSLDALCNNILATVCTSNKVPIDCSLLYEKLYGIHPTNIGEVIQNQLIDVAQLHIS